MATLPFQIFIVRSRPFLRTLHLLSRRNPLHTYHYELLFHEGLTEHFSRQRFRTQDEIQFPKLPDDLGTLQS